MKKDIPDMNELFLFESVKLALTRPKGKGIPNEEVPKLIEHWVLEAKRKKHARK